MTEGDEERNRYACAVWGSERTALGPLSWEQGCELDEVDLTWGVLEWKKSLLRVGSPTGRPNTCLGNSTGTQMVKSLPAMQETWVQSLGQEDSLEKKMATHSSILPGRSHGRRSLGGYSPWGLKELDMTERLHFHFHFQSRCTKIMGGKTFMVVSGYLIFSKTYKMCCCRKSQNFAGLPWRHLTEGIAWIFDYMWWVSTSQCTASLKVSLVLLTLVDGASGLTLSIIYFQKWCVYICVWFHFSLCNER